MVDDIALSILTANSWTGISTFAPETSLVTRAFRAEDTLRAACFIWVPIVLWDAFAHTPRSAERVRTTR